MPSHAYFHAYPHQYDWKAADPREETPEGDRERRRIADALIAAIPQLELNGDGVLRDVDGSPLPLVWLYMPQIEVTVYLTYVHVRLGWYTQEEMARMNLVPILHKMHEVLTEVAGFGMFEHGCQGLDVEGSIDLVPETIAPTTGRVRSLLGGVQGPITPLEV